MVCHVSVADSCAAVTLLVILLVRRKRRKSVISRDYEYNSVPSAVTGTTKHCCILLREGWAFRVGT